MNRAPVHSTAIVAAPDLERRVLERRIKAAKDKLFKDLDRASALVKTAAGEVGHTAFRAALIGGALLLGAAVAMFIHRRTRRHRIRVTWR